MKTWEELKKQGSSHYKTGLCHGLGWSLEPVDLYAAMGDFAAFARCSIIKYAFRNGCPDLSIEKKLSDLDKIIDYAEKLQAYYQKSIDEGVNLR